MSNRVDGSVTLDEFTSLDAHYDIEEMSDGYFSQTLWAGDLSDFVVFCPEVALNSLNFFEFVIHDKKMKLGARSRSVILKDPIHPIIISLR